MIGRVRGGLESFLRGGLVVPLLGIAGVGLEVELGVVVVLFAWSCELDVKGRWTYGMCGSGTCERCMWCFDVLVLSSFEVDERVVALRLEGLTSSCLGTP